MMMAWTKSQQQQQTDRLIRLVCVAVLIQDKINGRVVTMEDNHASLAANRMMAGNEEGREAINKLLTGGK